MGTCIISTQRYRKIIFAFNWRNFNLHTYLYSYFSGIGYIVGKFIGTIDFSELDYQSIFLFGQKFANEISELSQNELLVLQCWYILALVSISVVSFITMLWIPEIVYTEKVSFEALYYSIIKIFTHLKIQ